MPASSACSGQTQPMYSIEQIELIRRLRNSGLTKEQVVQAFESFERVETELGNLYTVPISLSQQKAVAAAGSQVRNSNSNSKTLLWTATCLHSVSCTALFFWHPHAENPAIQMQDSWLSHVLLLWTPHLEFIPTRPYLDIAQPCHLLKPNQKPSSPHSISAPSKISQSSFLSNCWFLQPWGMCCVVCSVSSLGKMGNGMRWMEPPVHVLHGLFCVFTGEDGGWHKVDGTACTCVAWSFASSVGKMGDGIRWNCLYMSWFSWLCLALRRKMTACSGLDSQ